MRDRALINQKLNGRMEKGGSYDTRRPLYRSAPVLCIIIYESLAHFTGIKLSKVADVYHGGIEVAKFSLVYIRS